MKLDSLGLEGPARICQLLQRFSSGTVLVRCANDDAQADTTRALARDEYRLTQVADKQKAWKGNVAKLKDAQDSVKTTRENFYRSAGAHLVDCSLHLTDPASSTDATAV